MTRPSHRSPAAAGREGTPRSRFADVARFPRLERRLRERITKLTHDTTACPHVRSAPVLTACAIRPAAGLHCVSCAAEHAERHDPAQELRCDQCGECNATIHAFALQLVARGLAVRDRRGERGAICGEIILGGFGVCPRCFEAKAAA